jgi:hypothetical protein
VVDRLLASEQHGVRYARHWLDVLRYADVDERMLAAPGIYLWRDWIIGALNSDVPYDQFVRSQLTGDTSGPVPAEVTATSILMNAHPASAPENNEAGGLLEANSATGIASDAAHRKAIDKVMSELADNDSHDGPLAELMWNIIGTRRGKKS